MRSVIPAGGRVRLKRVMYLVLLASAVLPLLLSCRPAAPDYVADLKPRAAIVDQLHILSPNPAFIDKAVDLLESYGFSVDVWEGEQVTVDFYRELASYGYRLIVLRAHGGIMLRVSEQGGIRRGRNLSLYR